jgi:uncharacterized radical SAM superfamily protein
MESKAVALIFYKRYIEEKLKFAHKIHLGYVVDDILVDLLSGHDKQESLQVVRCDLVEDDLDVERVVEPERVVPDRAAEDQVVDGAVSLQLCVKNLDSCFVSLGTRHRAIH